MAVELFFNTLYGKKPEKDHILIWEKRPDKKVSYWFNHVSDAIKHIRNSKSKYDTYVGCGTSGRALQSFRRCTADEISGIPAAWIDVDILNPVAHSKLNLPENEQKALEIIEPFPLKPTIIVHSGHGYQFWWVFDTFGSIGNMKVRDHAADLLHKFTWTMRDCARSMGYDLDMTFDLSRVFRIPGTFNCKDNPPLPVKMEKCDASLLYDIKKFDEAVDLFRVELGESATSVGERKKTVKTIDGTVITGEHFIMDPKATPNPDQLQILLDFEPKFKQSWEHNRKDFKSGDDSASAYDLSLASFTTAAGWEPQEIVNLLIAFRVKHGLHLKLNDQYFQKTLRASSNALKDKEAFDTLEEIIADRALLEKDPDKKKVMMAKAKAILTQIIKVKITRVVKYLVDPPEYRLEIEDNCIHLGGIKSITSQPQFRDRLADAIGIYMPTISAKKWQDVAQALLNLCEEVSAGEDTSNKGQIRHWLRNFLDQYPPLYDKNEGALTNHPYFYHEYLYISGPELRKYAGMFWHEVVSRKQLGVMLKEYGFEPLQINVKTKDGYVGRSIWRIEIAKDQVARQRVNMDFLQEAINNELEAQIQENTVSAAPTAEVLQ